MCDYLIVKFYCVLIISFSFVSISLQVFLVKPNLSYSKQNRKIVDLKIEFNDKNVTVIKLYENINMQYAENLKTEYFITPLHTNDFTSQKLNQNFEHDNCQTFITGNNNSPTNIVAAVTVCDQLYLSGLIQFSDELYFIEPLHDQINNLHILYKTNKHGSTLITPDKQSSRRKRKRVRQRIHRRNVLENEKKTDFLPSEQTDKEFIFNLTGDTFDFETDSRNNFNENNENLENLKIASDRNVKHETIKWRREDIDDEDVGYLVDSAWEVNLLRESNGEIRSIYKDEIENRQTKLLSTIDSGSLILNETNDSDQSTMNEERQQQRQQQQQQQRWLEIVVIVDHSVIEFHGGIKQVRRYVLTLMNIVSAVYKDSTLNAGQLKLVLSKLILINDKNGTQVRERNAKRSLENVNNWNYRYIQSLSPAETQHDIAVWLTRLDIGGPSGYAPVSGTCDPERSCSLNRDEGLTSAFIIAHEMAHILGLSHDGDRKSNNNCDTEIGNIMAPLVTATFHLFTWSSCSRREFQNKVMRWPCLKNPPRLKNVTYLNGNEIETVFTMDEQCRMEFGNGYTHCRGFDIVEPCSHLWCGHVDSPLVCKTKKGPPLQRTACGLDKWCIDGYCEKILNPLSESAISMNDYSNNVDVSGRYERGEPIQHNPLNGGWTKWSKWSPCSSTCERSVSYRTRQCTNPRPAYGGKYCSGKSEEFRICILDKCSNMKDDVRTQECARLNQLIEFDDPIRVNFTWLPYESERNSLKCQLTCQSRETGEIFLTGENLRDGATCSYDNPHSICIQGQCYPIGCDGILNSTITEDLCGDCGGNNSNCVNTTFNLLNRRNSKRASTKITILPHSIRHISIQTNITLSDADTSESDKFIMFIFKDRRRHMYNLSIPQSKSKSNVLDQHLKSTIIVAGTKFHLEQIQKYSYLITGFGQLLQELIVSIQVSELKNTNNTLPSFHLSSHISYVQNKNVINNSSRYQWIEGGWGPCSKRCGMNGGRRRRTQACRDTVTKRIVTRRHCSLVTKPPTKFQICNKFSCSYEWITDEWEHCTTTCGSRGIKSRQIYCIYKSSVTSNTTNRYHKKLWKYHIVSPDHCSLIDRPETVQPCNRFPCPVYWNHGNWSQCSTSCGEGFQTREIYCPVLTGESLFTCGTLPPQQRRSCFIEPKTSSVCRRGKRKRRCRGDSSKYCELPLLSHYCVVPSFREQCCKSCTGLNELPE